MSINWEEYGLYHGNLPTDWQHVTSIDNGGGYEWTTLHAFYSRAERIYYWSGDSGCSCNYWGEDLHSPADFQTGDKDALLRSIRSFAEDHYVSGAAALDAAEQVRRFRPGSCGCSEHKPVQHRDGCPPWCNACGLDAGGNAPKSAFKNLGAE